MTILDRYLGRRVLGAMLKVMVSMVLLVVLIDLLTHTRENIVKYQTPPEKILLYYICMVPSILFEYHAAAMAALAAGMLVLGKAAQDQEITAAMAGGASLLKLMRAPLALAFGLSVAAFALGETAGVRAAQTGEIIRTQYLARYSGSDRSGASWTGLGGGWNCHVLKFNRLANSGEDVFLHSLTEEVIQEIRAGRIYWDATREQWLLENGIWCKLYPKQDWAQSVERITQMPAPFSETPEDLFALEQPASAKSAQQLASDLHRAQQRGIPVGSDWTEFHVKFARPSLCFIMMLLAIPFSIRFQRGGRAAGLGLSVAIALAYVLVFFASIGLGHLGKLPPFLAAWAANILFLAAGIALFKKTAQ